MNIITRHNYEEYFLLYNDDELTAAEKRAVEDFLELNPDLRIEFEMIREAVVSPEPVVFHHKDILLKTSSSLINETNYEQLFVMYCDDELSSEEKDSVDQFVFQNPAYQTEFELIQRARLQPDHTIVFADKTSLYRTEEDAEKVFVMPWRSIAAAAVVFLFLSGIAYYFIDQEPASSTQVAIVPKKDSQRVARSTIPEQAANGTNPNQSIAAVEKVPVKKPTLAQKRDVNREAVKVNESTDQLLTASKKIEDQSNGRNIQLSSSVIKENPGVEITKMEPVNNTALTTTKQIVDEPFGAVEENPYAFNASNEEIEILNTSVSKKNKLRGLFRKVSRVVEKTTNIETAGKGIRIANFEIALK